jgi:hypothetical protein
MGPTPPVALAEETEVLAKKGGEVEKTPLLLMGVGGAVALAAFLLKGYVGSMISGLKITIRGWV